MERRNRKLVQPKGAARMVVLAMVVSLVIVWAEPAVARMAPDTLADRRPVQAGPVEPGFPIDYLGVLWQAPGDHHHDEGGDGPEPHGAVRFRHDGTWGSWVPLIEDGIEAEGGWASALVNGDDADAYQVRGIPGYAVGPQAVAINTTDGPLVEIDDERGGAASAIESTQCRSRADWGADEKLRSDANGNEIWPPEHYPVQVATAHHTATDNNDPDPEATVRAIYRYHAVDQGWGDIGYQYLIDESGVVYEGRWSGSESDSCELFAGDGSEFGHEDGDLDGDGVLDEMTTAAHVGGWNSGNMGVALLGEFTDHPRFGGAPKAAAVTALADLLAELGLRHSIDPTAMVNYVNPVNGAEKTIDTISGHRDWSSTECPGGRLYDQLPTIRQNVKTKMAAAGDAPPSVTLTDPPDGSTLSGTISVTADAGDDSGVNQVEFFVDGSSIGVDGDGSDSGWSVSWDTTEIADGGHTVSATATDTAGHTASDSVGVTVSNGTAEPSATMHVADLDGAAKSTKNQWRATITITVVDAGGAPVANATVSGTWTTLSSAAEPCMTSRSGTCSVTSPLVHKRTDSLTYRVDGIDSSLTYDPSANTDPDGDSDRTTITVAKSS